MRKCRSLTFSNYSEERCARLSSPGEEIVKLYSIQVTQQSVDIQENGNQELVSEDTNISKLYCIRLQQTAGNSIEENQKLVLEDIAISVSCCKLANETAGNCIQENQNEQLISESLAPLSACGRCENFHSRHLDAMFPIPRKLKSFQGPHSTCLMSSETYIRRYSNRRGDGIVDVYMGRTVAFALYRFLISFSSGLFSMIGFVLCAILFALGYASTRLFLRFQYKVTVLLVMLQRRPFHFKVLNDAIVYTLHVLLLLVGGFGWMSLLFVEM